MEGYYFARKKKEVNGEVFLEVPMIVESNMVQPEGGRISMTRIGFCTLPCVYVWIPEGYYLLHQQDLEQQAKSYLRSLRCLVQEPGRPCARIVCPEKNRCSTCPKRQHVDFNTLRDLRLEDFLRESSDEGHRSDFRPEVFQSPEPGPQELAVSRDALRCLNETLDDIAVLLEEESPRYALIFAQLRAGETNASEIARRCGLKAKHATEDVRRVQALSRQFYMVLNP